MLTITNSSRMRAPKTEVRDMKLLLRVLHPDVRLAVPDKPATDVPIQHADGGPVPEQLGEGPVAELPGAGAEGLSRANDVYRSIDPVHDGDAVPPAAFVDDAKRDVPEAVAVQVTVGDFGTRPRREIVTRPESRLAQRAVRPQGHRRRAGSPLRRERV